MEKLLVPEFSPWMPALCEPPTPKWYHVRVLPRIPWRTWKRTISWTASALGVLLCGWLTHRPLFAGASIVPSAVAIYIFGTALGDAIRSARVSLQLHRKRLFAQEANLRTYLGSLASGRLSELIRVVKTGGDSLPAWDWVGTSSLLVDQHWHKEYAKTLQLYERESRDLAVISCQLMGIRRQASDGYRPLVPHLQESVPRLERDYPAFADFLRFLVPLGVAHDAHMVEVHARRREEDAERRHAALLLAENKRRAAPLSLADRLAYERWMAECKATQQAERDAQIRTAREYQSALSQLKSRIDALTVAEKDLAARGEWSQFQVVEQQRQRLEGALEDVIRDARVI